MTSHAVSVHQIAEWSLTLADSARFGSGPGAGDAGPRTAARRGTLDRDAGLEYFVRMFPRYALIIASALWLSASAHAQSDWVRVRPDGMGFEAEFPSEPTHRTTSYRTEAGVWVASSWEIDDTVTDRAFQVTVKDYSRYDTSGASIDGVLEAMCRGFDPDAHVGPLRGARVPARRCLSTRGVGGTEIHVYWRAPRLYVVSQICGRGTCDRAVRRRFLSSFRLR